jgi:hypothetical protein
VDFAHNISTFLHRCQVNAPCRPGVVDKSAQTCYGVSYWMSNEARRPGILACVMSRWLPLRRRRPSRCPRGRRCRNSCLINGNELSSLQAGDPPPSRVEWPVSWTGCSSTPSGWGPTVRRREVLWRGSTPSDGRGSRLVVDRAARWGVAGHAKPQSAREALDWDWTGSCASQVAGSCRT